MLIHFGGAPEPTEAGANISTSIRTRRRNNNE